MSFLIRLSALVLGSVLLGASVSKASPDPVQILSRWSGQYSGFGPSEALTSTRMGETQVIITKKGIEFRHAKSDGTTATEFYPIATLDHLKHDDEMHLNQGTSALRSGDFDKDRLEVWFLFGPESKTQNVVTLAMKVEGFGLVELSRNFSAEAVANGAMPRVSLQDKLTRPSNP